MAAELRESYDRFPYQSFPFPQTHPDRLATVGSLFGMMPAPVDRCRVLELGCAAGGNLVPMAAALPHGEFVGIDFSDVQIREGNADVAALGLANIRLLNMDIAAFDESFGTFDYIIAHGVYSWVPDTVQEKILAICSRQLAPQGIAYVSYNTLPGWGMRGVVRAAMRYHTRQFTDPKTRVQQARAMLDFLADSTQGDASAYGVMLRTEADEVRRKPDYYLLHDHLEEVNQPLYFHVFVERATRHGLRYLGEATFANMFASDLAPRVADTLQRIAPDLLKREQFMDFLRNRTFRQTLLVHEDVALERKISPLRVRALRAASRARPARDGVDPTTGAEEFRAPEGSAMTTAHRPTKAALRALAERWPMSVGFDELCRVAAARLEDAGSWGDSERNALATALLSAFAAGVIELHVAAPPFVLDSGERPVAGAVPRLQARRGPLLTTLRHESIQAGEATRKLIVALDGTRDRAALAADMFPEHSAADGRRLLEEALPQLARQALLVA